MATIVTNNKWYKGIANAIRSKNGVSTRYRPDQLAAAINSLTVYGTLSNPENPDYSSTAEPIKTNDSYYTAIANAIRAKNGADTKYRPDQLASAIMELDAVGPLTELRVSAIPYSVMSNIYVTHLGTGERYNPTYETTGTGVDALFNDLPVGQYTVTITFMDPAYGSNWERTITIDGTSKSLYINYG